MKIEKRDSVLENIGEYCHLSKEFDHVEVSEWVNGEGIDIQVQSEGLHFISMTYGQFKLAKKMVKFLNKR